MHTLCHICAGISLDLICLDTRSTVYTQVCSIVLCSDTKMGKSPVCTSVTQCESLSYCLLSWEEGTEVRGLFALSQVCPYSLSALSSPKNSNKMYYRKTVESKSSKTQFYFILFFPSQLEFLQYYQVSHNFPLDD